MSDKINQWERATKLQASALTLVMDGSRSMKAWADHLHSFVFALSPKALVNYDDSAYRRIDRDQYVFVASSLRPEHFPVRGKGQHEVTYDYLEFDKPTTATMLLAVKDRSDIRLPNFAETMAYHKANPEERMKAPVISLCGTNENWNDELRVACVDAGEDGLRLDWFIYRIRLFKYYRCLVVRK